MSLHKFADMVAKQGRGDDSLLIHMTPDEVQRLQKFAEANGRSLTINPETGLPEAGMLSDLFKSIAPIALGAFLGPAGAALGGGFMSAGMAGLTVGGLTTLATGSLSRGLMAGLGAYGGAGLGESLMGAGTGALSAEAGGAALSNAGLTGEAALTAEADQIAQRAIQSKLAAATPLDTAGAGLAAISKSPQTLGSFAMKNLGNISAAATPIMAGAMVPTTTKMPENTSPAYIRQKLYDPYTQTYKTLAPVRADQWGSRSFSDAYTNPQTGEMATLQPRAPSGMAGGGIVALANGGVPGFAAGTYIPTDQQIVDYFKGLDQTKLGSGALDAQIAADMQKFDVGADRIAQVTGTQGRQADYEKRFVQAVNTPTTSAEEFMAATKDVGLQNQALENAMDAAGMSQAAQYASTHGLTDTTTPQTDFYNQFGYKLGALPGDQGGLEGLYSNINYSAQGLQSLIDAGKMTGQQAREAALTEMNRIGMSAGDLKAATGKTLAELFPDTKKVDKPITVINPITGIASAAGPTTTTVLPTTPLTNAPAGTSNPYGNVNNPGDLTFNPDGTVTVQPNIPGRPYGGFSGMNEVKNAYTAGGGSLGYTAKAPRTIDEFNQLYNRQTGDSLAAYDYLMGKGGGKYPVQSKAASGAEGIMRPYWSAGMKYKPKFLSYDKEGKIVSNDGTATAGNVKAGDLTKAQSIEVVDSSGETNQTYTAVLQPDGTYLAGNGKRYDVTGKELAADGGMMGYAMGGGLGSLGSYSDGGRLLKGPGDGVSDSIPATIGEKQQPARLADGEFVIPARIVSELGNGSTDAGAKKLYAMMDRVQKARGKTTGKNKVAANSRADKYLPA